MGLRSLSANQSTRRTLMQEKGIIRKMLKPPKYCACPERNPELKLSSTESPAGFSLIA